ncbi:radical SAM family heme chaperone HemW [Lutimaribacter sp. EGI FJ00015]|uniref:Radical SAM family heme chaperone HemW n=1 Tax=Lutimaribacter degradans TaxID=2945989 RepID=A0ACC5ZUE8_9RHOB|nr:radical SAM family heme chaperone HemW [Lutimaribacter sp. EGI FJ00013]MCM2561968.1 radical SAM family heme chaperone HemW [Lutimaribacter sp. EGI FJ00013]MCO0613000.1 radical SAM family heme chaperone HemW [Lutimaribacter sp. EGI FJ00015]MCO0635800.1 radical SAM family heme chaperone HemW [Lutimaribacter sp. EGI FJ00014]
MAEDWQQGGFGLYIHWPFCQAKCPYCDFNSHVVAAIDQTRWLNAYLAEIDRYATLVPGRVLTSVFFGGGTPSLMEPEIVASIIDRVRRHWPVANDLEITLEANPGSVEAGRFTGYAQAGVNRVSMGVQALNDTDLRRLGRLHTVADARRAFDIARSHFDRVSFDLIYARQDQTLDDWRTELSQALEMAVDHLSLYQLTIEQGTAFGDRYNAGKLRGLPVEDLAADMYQATQEICDTAGMPAYEISNHARSGAESRHNRVYWRYGDYIGIGPGAHGRLTLDGARHATEQWRLPGKWMQHAEANNADEVISPLSGEEQAAEFLLMGLRLVEGVDPTRFEKLAGRPLPVEKLAYLEEFGMIDHGPSHLRVTGQGRVLLNAVLEQLLVG